MLDAFVCWCLLFSFAVQFTSLTRPFVVAAGQWVSVMVVHKKYRLQRLQDANAEHVMDGALA